MEAKQPAPPTACTLYALASGRDETRALKQCYLCGGPTVGQMPSASYQAMLRLAPGQRLAPGCVNSDHVCWGCHLALRESCGVEMPPYPNDPECKPRVEQMMAPRRFSWVLTRTKALACGPMELPFLRAACLEPPTAPYAIVVADADYHVLHKAKAVNPGGKHSIYFGNANIVCKPDDLKEFIKLAGMVKIATHGVPENRHAEACDSRYIGGRKLCKSWNDKTHPDAPTKALTDLALRLCHDLEECRSLYPQETRDAKVIIPATA